MECQEWPCGEDGRATPWLLCPSSGREHQDTVCSWAEAGYGMGSFPSTDIAQGHGKGKIIWFCDFFLTVKYGFILWETKRIKLRKGRKWIQAPYAGASPVAAKLTSEKDPGSTAQGRQAWLAATWKAQNNFWRHSSFPLSNWLAWALGLGSLKEWMGAKERETEGSVP